MVALTATLDKTLPTSIFALIIIGLLLFLRWSEPTKTGKTALTLLLVFAFISGILLMLLVI